MSQNNKEEGKLGAKFARTLMCSEFNQIKERYKVTREIWKSNFDVENVYGLGVKTAKKQRKLGAKFE